MQKNLMMVYESSERFRDNFGKFINQLNIYFGKFINQLNIYIYIYIYIVQFDGDSNSFKSS